ncbi:hypothetical protein H6G00_01380 [Leptolyngbya sp. FACHB-541]|uniref:hypothetical protein n=1 Tax=Leptolyngbya sp. FACHB-541 TaxID=2692810 RepID=UPI0016890072|nr:hypothetical protein [Leptolyngbya sp. FACHB-541]MBD1995281.1 hypothetical protein [Leptolyngbya sp. FACHB-541]
MKKTRILLVLLLSTTVISCGSSDSEDNSEWGEILESGISELKAQGTCFALPGSDACDQIEACYETAEGCFVLPNFSEEVQSDPDGTVVQEVQEVQEVGFEAPTELPNEQLAATTSTEISVESIDELPPGASPGWLPRCLEMKNPDSAELGRGEWDWIQNGGPLNLDQETLNSIVRCKANYGIRMGFPDGSQTCAPVLMVRLRNTTKYGEIVRDSRDGNLLAIYEGWWNEAICGVAE